MKQSKFEFRQKRGSELNCELCQDEYSRMINQTLWGDQ